MDSLSDLLWRDYRTVLVCGQVTCAVWRPAPGGFWILMAPNEEQAWEAMTKINQLKALFPDQTSCHHAGIG